MSEKELWVLIRSLQKFNSEYDISIHDMAEKIHKVIEKIPHGHCKGCENEYCEGGIDE